MLKSVSFNNYFCRLLQLLMQTNFLLVPVEMVHNSLNKASTSEDSEEH